MSPRWTTRLEARLGPSGLTLALHSRLPWGARAPRWRQAQPGPLTRAQAVAALDAALTRAQASGRGPWPPSLALALDDAWVLHCCLRGRFDRLGPAGAAQAAQRFVEQALGGAAGPQRLALLPQPDGQSLWVSALPEALCQDLADVAQRHALRLAELRPAAQQLVDGPRRWPRDGVLALAHAGGWLLALRRAGSWVAVSQEAATGPNLPGARVDALQRFHGLPEGAARWAVLLPGQTPPPGWTPLDDGARAAAGAPA